jgi:hypothetical protein
LGWKDEVIFIFDFGRVPTGQAFGTRFFICPSGQIKRAQTNASILHATLLLKFGIYTSFYLKPCVRDCSENPFAFFSDAKDCDENPGRRQSPNLSNKKSLNKYC